MILHYLTWLAPNFNLMIQVHLQHVCALLVDELVLMPILKFEERPFLCLQGILALIKLIICNCELVTLNYLLCITFLVAIES